MNGWDQGNIVGVMGGMGPMASALLLEMVVNRTDSVDDQHHIDMIVSQHSSTPDRTAYLFDQTKPNPIPVLIHDAKLLQRSGVDFLAIPCNTSHAFVEELRDSVDLQVLDILESTVDEVARRADSKGQLVGLLATDGTLKAGLYARELERRDFEVVVPDPKDQLVVMDLIYRQVKGGEPDDLDVLHRLIERLRGKGASLFILGCTELSVAADELGLLDHPEIIDSLQSLADAIIARAGRRVK